jgi:hypothetical protein
MEKIVVSAPRSVPGPGWPQVSALVEAEGRHELYFRASQGPLATGSATFLFATLGAASKLAVPLHVRGAVPAGFLALARSFMHDAAAWNSRWLDEYHEVPLDVTSSPLAPEPATEGRGVACFFSGGVDSFDTVLRHPDEITHLIYVHGYDTPLANTKMRATILQSLRRAAAGLGKPLIEVETNLRELLPQWGHPVATLTEMGIAYLLSPQFRRVYIASDYAGYWPGDCPPQQLPEAELVDLDTVQIIFDGRGRRRCEKTAQLATSQTALSTLRVCWLNKSMAYNCGQCEKCLRTMFALHLAGALDRCQTFDRPIELSAVRRMLLHAVEVPFWQEILEGLERGADVELAAGVRERMRHLAPLGMETAATLAKAQARIAELEDELQQLKTSRSWQVTAPLRSAGKMAHKLSQRRQR